MILIDAYQDITIPFYMSSAEFFTLVRDRLAPNGVMAVNMNMHSDGEGSMNEALSDTIASVFPAVSTVDVPGATNRELFASRQPVDGPALAREAASLPDAPLRQLLRRTSSRLTDYAGGRRILTDDQAPVEILGMRALDGIIHEQAASSRDELMRLLHEILHSK